MPENAQLSFVGVFALQSRNGIVHAEILVIFGNDFDLVFVIQHKFFKVINEGIFLAKALSKQFEA